MLRVGIQGWGSEGDLRPLLALAGRLRSKGHAAQLVLTTVDGKDYAPACDALDVPLRLVPQQAPITLQQLVRDAKSKNPTKLMNAVLDLTFYPHLESMYQAALTLCRQSDVVVGGSNAWVVKAAALASGVPFVSLHYYPGVVPSRVVPPAIFPNWRLLARPGWALLKLLMDLAFRGPARKFFAQKQLPPIRHAIPDVLFSDRLNLLAASPVLYPPAPDWSDAFRMTGELRMPRSVEPWQPSAALQAFLERGAPVLMTLGSMEHMAPARALALMQQSARLAGVRAIIQTKTGHDEGQDGDLYYLPWVPHEALAPHCALLVHHGGAGTSHAALRAGRPALLLPFIFEQGLWAKQLVRVGAAGPPLSFWRARPKTVARAIEAALASAALRQAAERAAERMASEDGSLTAASAIERVMGA
ncbi:MAG TPA: glycosyltransferase [Polyangiales bacterium]